MPYSGGYIPGDRKYDCDVCGFTYRFSDMRKGVSGSQKGFDVCLDCFDAKRPYEDTNPKPRKERPLPKVI